MVVLDQALIKKLRRQKNLLDHLLVEIELNRDEQVAIVGNIPQLGCWDFRNALML